MIDLSFSKFPASNSKKTAPILILHGLFGSKQNWKSLSKQFSQRLSTDIYILDFRNHGNSAWHPEFTLPSLVEDVGKFIQKEIGTECHLIGHSLGGKVSMMLGLSPYQRLLNKLIIVDMPPRKLNLSSLFHQYTQTMIEIENQKVKSLKEADHYLAKIESNLAIRQFLLTNLVKSQDRHETAQQMHPLPNDQLCFRLNLQSIISNLESVSDFKTLGIEECDKETLFIYGTKSGYIKPTDEDIIKNYFPNYQMKGIDCGHWVHSEQPKIFSEVVLKFLEQV